VSGSAGKGQLGDEEVESDETAKSREIPSHKGAFHGGVLYSCGDLAVR
jgi:hypothetical protein